MGDMRLNVIHAVQAPAGEIALQGRKLMVTKAYGASD